MIDPANATSARHPGEFSMELRRVLEDAQALGLIGGADLDVTLAHAAGFAEGVEGEPETCVDLGSGGGVPGLVLAELWPATRMWLLEGSVKRAVFLSSAVARLGRHKQVTVLTSRAEVAGRSPQLRGEFDTVTARGFGPPAVTAECAAPLLRAGGMLVVSEPPADQITPTTTDRWPSGGLRLLGMEKGEAWNSPFHYQAIEQSVVCSDRYPRRTGIPNKRPLF